MKLLPFRTRRATIDPGEVALHARNVRFDWRDTPLHWMPAEPIASHLINALNLLLPEGERMFCQAFSEAMPLVKDDRLREQMLGFIGQESMHAETHNGVLDEVLSAHGIEVRPYVEQMEYLFRKTLGPREGQDARAEFQTLVERLGFIATLEHFFAFLGDWVLNADLEQFGADPNMADLFRWHGAEEVEHRHVAHDVAAYFGIGYVRRCALMLLVFPIFLSLVVRGTKYLVRQDPSLPDLGYPRLLLRVFGAMWRGALPGVPSLLWSAVSVAQPGYTPESVGSTAQAVAYLAKSPAARALAS
ncbi:metal-dependent hydrolase [Nocardia terpenica]|uniref:Metal-dependent hydrolase n=1 Tax=Nocardia terpenica TaxID=455432 RepID=A0A161XFY0_9NOCA|nr:metal-dependent hydrolase [Nocardia terpenica]KZM72358.1 metal-dependent hydrolase [Nocardia terpenica]NQE86752.1 metal-dependent hydrolase [Nocardia terpenica]